MQFVRTFSSLLVLALCLSLTAACSPWTIVKQANPNPLAQTKDLALEPLHLEGVKVGKKAEAEYLAGKDQKQQESWKADLQAMTQMFNDTLMQKAQGVKLAPAPGQGLVVRPTILMIEPGTFTGVFNMPSQLEISLQILDAQGTVLDEILYKISINADLYHPSVGQRLRDAAVEGAKRAASYLTLRAQGK